MKKKLFELSAAAFLCNVRPQDTPPGGDFLRTSVVKAFASAHPAWPEIGAQVTPDVAHGTRGAANQPRDNRGSILRRNQLVRKLQLFTSHLTQCSHGRAALVVASTSVLKRAPRNCYDSHTIQGVHNEIPCVIELSRSKEWRYDVTIDKYKSHNKMS
jgi:hypothetical protein